MNYFQKSYKKGFIGTVILIVIALIILGYFRIDIQNVLNGPYVRANLMYAWGLIVYAYNYMKIVIDDIIHGRFKF